LTILFLLVLFAYLSALSARGMTGAIRIAWRKLSHRGDRAALERRKNAILALRDAREGPVVALNVVLERENAPGEPFEIPIADAAGSMGAIVVDGAKLEHRDPGRAGSQNLMAFVARQIEVVLEARGAAREVGIVEWK